MSDVISKDLKTVLKGLRLSKMLDTLPERLTLARQGKMPHQDFLLTVLGDESSRRQSNAVRFRSRSRSVVLLVRVYLRVRPDGAWGSPRT